MTRTQSAIVKDVLQDTTGASPQLFSDSDACSLIKEIVIFFGISRFNLFGTMKLPVSVSEAS